MIVYRIQDLEGRGPFRLGFTKHWLEIEKIGFRPMFEEFDMNQFHWQQGEYWGCGCRSINQLRQWFTPKEYQTLLSFKYQAVKLKANKILAESRIQLLFMRNKPLHINIKPIVLYENNN